MVAASHNLRSITETVSFMVFINTNALCLLLYVLNSTTNWNFAGTPRLSSAVTLTLDVLSANSLLLLSENNLLLVKMIGSVMHIKVLEVVVLRSCYSRSFSRKEFLLIQMSRINFSLFWSWTLRLRKLLNLRALESFCRVRWLDFNIWWMCLRLFNSALLLKKHCLLILCMQKLLLIMRIVLTISELLMLQAQSKSISIAHLSLTAMYRSQLLLADICWLGKWIDVSFVGTRNDRAACTVVQLTLMKIWST